MPHRWLPGSDESYAAWQAGDNQAPGERSYADHETEAMLEQDLINLGSTREELEAIIAFARAFDRLFVPAHIPTADDEIPF